MLPIASLQFASRLFDIRLKRFHFIVKLRFARDALVVGAAQCCLRFVQLASERLGFQQGRGQGGFRFFLEKGQLQAMPVALFVKRLLPLKFSTRVSFDGDAFLGDQATEILLSGFDRSDQ